MSFTQFSFYSKEFNLKYDIKKSLFFFLIVLLFVSCDKGNNNTDQSAIIDVTKQWQVDAQGSLILGLSDGQWKNKIFTTEEQNLFASLDTTNLSGTTKPDSVFESTPVSNNFTIPNPFASFNQLQLNFSNGYDGQVVLKFVVVDSLLKSIDKGSKKIQASVCSSCPLHPSTSNLITIMPNMPTGKFRFYYTLSTASSKNFYTTWGNIEKK